MGSTVQKFVELVGRILLMVLFLLSGVGKIGQYAGTADYMASAGVSGSLLPLVIITEIAGAVLVIIGWRTRLVSLLLAGYTILAALIFHGNVSDPNQMVHFLKNLSIAGGFLLLVANGAGPLSLDQRRRPAR